MKKILILISLLLGYSGMFAQEAKKIAVFDPEGDVSAGIKAIVREEISTVIVNTGDYIVLERQLINKVLEENKFQMGGLVDNSQIGEIGKKIGANYVFVVSITATGSKTASSGQTYFLSFKLIDVTTARIEMQQTGKSKDEGELDVVARNIVNEMFFGIKSRKSENQAVYQSQGRERAATLKPGGLIADGAKVFSNGKELKKAEGRNMFENTDALRIYDKGVSRRATGTALVWSGAILGVAGFAGLIFGDNGESSGSYSYYGQEPDILFTLGVPCILAGGALIITGTIFRIVGKSSVRKSVDSYNGQQYALSNRREWQLSFKGNGIRFVYRF